MFNLICTIIGYALLGAIICFAVIVIRIIFGFISDIVTGAGAARKEAQNQTRNEFCDEICRIALSGDGWERVELKYSTEWHKEQKYEVCDTIVVHKKSGDLSFYSMHGNGYHNIPRYRVKEYAEMIAQRLGGTVYPIFEWSKWLDKYDTVGFQISPQDAPSPNANLFDPSKLKHL